MEGTRVISDMVRSEQAAIEILDNWFSSYGDKFPIDDYGCDEVFPNAILVH